MTETMSPIKKRTLDETLQAVKPYLKQYEDDLFFEVHNWQIPGYVYLGRGRGRVVFRKRGTDWVLKIPYNKYGLLDNRREVKMFVEHKGTVFPNKSRNQRGRLAKCELTKINGVDCVKMEYLRPVICKTAPDWIWELYDGAQVGRDKKGRVAVYDYALERMTKSKNRG